MRTLSGIENTITGIILAHKKNDARDMAKNIIQMLFEEDNLVVPPKQDEDLRIKMFDDFFEWHKSMGFVSLKRDDYVEWINQL
jgi:hypothetical protein